MILEVENLSIRFGTDRHPRRVIRDVSFHVAPGEILGVVGESGCGKSLTNLAVMGLLPPGASVRADKFELQGRDLRTLEKKQWNQIRGTEVAMIFQNPISALNPSLTVGTQLGEAVTKTNPKLRRDQVDSLGQELLDQVGITSSHLRMKSYPHELSGGMAQRVMIAMALASKPALLIADEPTTALDVTIQAQILELLERIRRESGMAIMLVSHDVGVVRQCTDRMQVMYSGEIVESGPTLDVTENPSHPYTKGLIASLPSRQKLPPKTRLVAIPGVVPPIDATIDGCRFKDRCAKGNEACETAPPVLPRTRANGPVRDGVYRCHF